MRSVGQRKDRIITMTKRDTIPQNQVNNTALIILIIIIFTVCLHVRWLWFFLRSISLCYGQCGVNFQPAGRELRSCCQQLWLQLSPTLNSRWKNKKEHYINYSPLVSQMELWDLVHLEWTTYGTGPVSVFPFISGFSHIAVICILPQFPTCQMWNVRMPQAQVSLGTSTAYYSDYGNLHYYNHLLPLLPQLELLTLKACV